MYMYAGIVTPVGPAGVGGGGGAGARAGAWATVTGAGAGAMGAGAGGGGGGGAIAISGVSIGAVRRGQPGQSRQARQAGQPDRGGGQRNQGCGRLPARGRAARRAGWTRGCSAAPGWCCRWWSRRSRPAPRDDQDESLGIERGGVDDRQEVVDDDDAGEGDVGPRVKRHRQVVGDGCRGQIIRKSPVNASHIPGMGYGGNHDGFSPCNHVAIGSLKSGEADLIEEVQYLLVLRGRCSGTRAGGKALADSSPSR